MFQATTTKSVQSIVGKRVKTKCSVAIEADQTKRHVHYFDFTPLHVSNGSFSDHNTRSLES